MRPNPSRPSCRQGWQRSLREVLHQHNRLVHDGSKRAGESTQADRLEILCRAFRQLHALGFAIQDVRSFRTKHLQALVNHWTSQGLKPATLQKYLSVLRVFAGWIGKHGLVPDSVSLVDDPAMIRRSQAAKVDRSWTGNAIDVRAKLKEVNREDERVGLQLELQLAFGLRLREACFLRPHLADNRTFLAVNWGTKGGRQRIVPIDTEYKRALLARAKLMAPRKQDSLIPARLSWVTWRNHFYYVCRKVQITREHGITSHGLRHEYINDLFELVSGEKTPVRGGRRQRLSREALKHAQQVVAEHAGHGRPQIATAYTGSFATATKTAKETDQPGGQLELPW